MGAALVALPSFEVAVRRRGATLPWAKLVGIHRKAHRASRLAPVETRRLEDLVEPFSLGLLLHQAGARHDHGIDVAVDVLALGDARGRAQILDAAIGA